MQHITSTRRLPTPPYKMMPPQSVDLRLRPSLTRAHHPKGQSTKTQSWLVFCQWWPYLWSWSACFTTSIQMLTKSKRLASIVKRPIKPSFLKIMSALIDRSIFQMVLARPVDSSQNQTIRRMNATNQSVRILRKSSSLTVHAWSASHTHNLDQVKEVVSTLNAKRENRLDSVDSAKLAQTIPGSLTVKLCASNQIANPVRRWPLMVNARHAQHSWLPPKMAKTVNSQHVRPLKRLSLMAPVKIVLNIKESLKTRKSARCQNVQKEREWCQMELVRSVMLTIVLQLTKNLARFHNVMQDKVSKKMQHAKTALHSKKLVSLDYNVSNLNVRKGKRSEKMPHVKNAHHSKQSSVKTITIVTEPSAVNLNVDLEKSLPLMVNVKDVNLSQSLMKEAEYACHLLVEIDKR